MNMLAAIVFIVLIAALIAAAAVTGVKKKTVPMIVSIAALAVVITVAAFVYKPSGNVPTSESVPQSSVNTTSSGTESASSAPAENSAESSSAQDSSSSSESSKEESKNASSENDSSKAQSSAVSSKPASSKPASSKPASSKAASSKTESRNTASKTESAAGQDQTVSSAQSERSENSESAASSNITIPELPVSSDGAVTLPFVPFKDVEVDVPSSISPTQPAAPRADGLDENETPILGIDETLPDDESDNKNSLRDGEYTASRGVIEDSDSVEAEVTVVIKNGKITDVKITPTKKTDEFEDAAEKLRQQIIDEQSADIDPVTGDNVISKAILGAAQDAINSAKA